MKRQDGGGREDIEEEENKWNRERTNGRWRKEMGQGKLRGMRYEWQVRNCYHKQLKVQRYAYLPKAGTYVSQSGGSY